MVNKTYDKFISIFRDFRLNYEKFIYYKKLSSAHAARKNLQDIKHWCDLMETRIKEQEKLFKEFVDSNEMKQLIMKYRKNRKGRD